MPKPQNPFRGRERTCRVPPADFESLLRETHDFCVRCRAMGVLVTGGAGFIGSHLTDRLVERGDEVVVLDDFSTGKRANLRSAEAGGALVIEADIRDRGAVDDVVRSHRPDVILHLAAQMDVRKSVADPFFDSSVNIGGTINVLEAAREVGARIVFASSGGAIYGEGEGRRLPFREQDDAYPDSPYGQSKLAGEGYCALYERLYGQSTIAIRIGNVYGPRQDPRGEAGVIAIFCGRFGAGEAPTVFGNGEQTRDYVYVDDIVEALMLAGASTHHGAINAGTGQETSVLDLIRGLAAEFGEDVAPVYEPERTGEVQRTAIDPARAEEVLEWRARVGLADGLSRTSAWFTSGESALAGKKSP
jgi:UDP-glucose 4-epimerase